MFFEQPRPISLREFEIPEALEGQRFRLALPLSGRERLKLSNEALESIPTQQTFTFTCRNVLRKRSFLDIKRRR